MRRVTEYSKAANELIQVLWRHPEKNKKVKPTNEKAKQRRKKTTSNSPVRRNKFHMWNLIEKNRKYYILVLQNQKKKGWERCDLFKQGSDKE